jgi:hypothetical protein
MRTALVVALSALATVISADLALQRIRPLPQAFPTVADGVAAVTSPGPDLLVLGSSHSRAFAPLKDELRRRAGEERVAIVTMEAGSGVSFEWVFNHRVAPLLDERDGSGRLVRPHLARALLVLTFSDLCAANDHTNIPRTAWTADEYLSDVAANGITEYNRSYLPPRVHRILSWSLLARRGLDVIDVAKFKLRSAEARSAAERAFVQSVREGYLTALRRCPATEEIDAIDRLIEDLKRRGVEPTLVLFPLPPITLEGPSDPVLAEYRSLIAEITQRHGCCVHTLDWVTSSPLGDDDFMADLDHASKSGAAKLVSWALADSLAFVAAPPPPREAGP